MKLIIDTNVFVSGIFFSGTPYEILNAWRRGRVTLVTSPEILDEYRRVGEELAIEFPGVDLEPWLQLFTVKAQVVEAKPLEQSVCGDPDDDKFLACAITSNTKTILSGDKHLLAVSGYEGITVLKPRAFVEKYLGRKR